MTAMLSANLGLLWQELDLPDRVRAAADAGFDAVECHFPYVTPPSHLIRALAETGLRMLAINTPPGPEGAFGLAAVPGRAEEARLGIGQALAYADAIGAGLVHVMAGHASGAAAQETFAETLAWAAGEARQRGLRLVIEPLNPHDRPGYFLTDPDRALALAEAAGPEVGLMLDCYHMARIGRDPVAVHARRPDRVFHVQFADAPGRGAPGQGALDLAAQLSAIRSAGYTGAFGAEYLPAGATEESLGWMPDLRAALG